MVFAIALAKQVEVNTREVAEVDRLVLVLVEMAAKLVARSKVNQIQNQNQEFVVQHAELLATSLPLSHHFIPAFVSRHCYWGH